MLPEGGESPPDFFALRLPPAAAAWGIALAPEAVGPLSRFLSRVDLWRRRTNLTGPFPAEELVLHALEAALGADFLPVELASPTSAQGAGFPGIPLAILRPDLSIVPVEPRRRRREFLDGCAAEIRIDQPRAVGLLLRRTFPRQPSGGDGPRGGRSSADSRIRKTARFRLGPARLDDRARKARRKPPRSFCLRGLPGGAGRGAPLHRALSPDGWARRHRDTNGEVTGVG